MRRIGIRGEIRCEGRGTGIPGCLMNGLAGSVFFSGSCSAVIRIIFKCMFLFELESSVVLSFIDVL